jgi:hypothetical protein
MQATRSRSRNNKPGVVDYEVQNLKKAKKKEMIWVNRENSKTVEDFYLVSDSSGINVGSEKRRDVVRVGNTFEFFSWGSLSKSKTLVGHMLSLIPADYNVYSSYPQFQRKFNVETATTNSFLVPRQINMETGEVY